MISYPLYFVVSETNEKTVTAQVQSEPVTMKCKPDVFTKYQISFVFKCWLDVAFGLFDEHLTSKSSKSIWKLELVRIKWTLIARQENALWDAKMEKSPTSHGQMENKYQKSTSFVKRTENGSHQVALLNVHNLKNLLQMNKLVVISMKNKTIK